MRQRKVKISLGNVHPGPVIKSQTRDRHGLCLLQEPCMSFVLRDVICTSCNDCRDLDLCRDPHLQVTPPHFISLIHLFIHSRYSFSRSFLHSFTHSFIHSFLPSFIPSFQKHITLLQFTMVHFSPCLCWGCLHLPQAGSMLSLL